MGETLQSAGFVNFAGRPASSPSFSTLSREIGAASSILPLSPAWAPANSYPLPAEKGTRWGP